MAITSRSKKDEVFVIKSVNFSEADKIITVFGKERGKFSLFAKGIRKLHSKNRGNMQTFTISKISYYEKTQLPLLLESEQTFCVDYTQISIQNVEKVLKVLNKVLPEESPSEYIFDSLKTLITKRISDEYVNKFLLYFLIQEGLVSNLSICDNCNSEDNEMYFDVNKFLTVCIKCADKNKIKNNILIKADKNLYTNKQFTKSIDRYIEKILNET